VKICSSKSSIHNLRSEILNLKSELFLQARSGTSLGEQLLETPFDFAQGRLRTRRACKGRKEKRIVSEARGFLCDLCGRSLRTLRLSFFQRSSQSCPASCGSAIAGKSFEPPFDCAQGRPDDEREGFANPEGRL